MKSSRDVAELAKTELIGKEITVVKAYQRSLEGLSGKVIDETLNMLVVDTGKQEVTIRKKDIIIKIRLEGKEIQIEGEKLITRPEDRLKKHWRKIKR